jgi:hypothetical protein
MVQLVLNYTIAFVALAAIYLGCRATIELAQDLIQERKRNNADRSPQNDDDLASTPITPDREMDQSNNTKVAQDKDGSDTLEKVARISAQQSTSAKIGSVILF